MAYQIPMINYKRLDLQLKPPRLCFQTLIVGLFVLAACIYSTQTATCPPLVPSSAAITTEQCSFAEYTETYTVCVAVGPVSNSLYYLYTLATPPSYSTAVRKVDASGSQIWMASLSIRPTVKSLSVDASEQNVYYASLTTSLIVLKLATSDGSIISQHQL